MTGRRVMMLGPALDVRGGISSVERLIMARAAESGWAIEMVPTMREGSAGVRAICFARAVGRLTLACLLGRIDLVHLHFSIKGSTLRKGILAGIAFAFGRPVVLHAHGSEYRAFFAGLPAPLASALGRFFARSARLIALSESWAAFYRQAFGLAPGRVTVLANPVAWPAAVPERRGREALTVVFLGRIAERKGAFELLRAFAALPAPLKARATLVLAGDGQLERARGLASELGLAGRVSVREWLTSAERDALLAEADLFALPSHNEGLPMALLEAMGWGLAAVTTPVGGIPELVTDGENGRLVEPGDVPALTAALGELLGDEAARLALGAAGRRAVEPLALEHYMAGLTAVYAAALAPSALEEAGAHDGPREGIPGGLDA